MDTSHFNSNQQHNQKVSPSSEEDEEDNLKLALFRTKQELAERDVRISQLEAQLLSVMSSSEELRKLLGKSRNDLSDREARVAQLECELAIKSASLRRMEVELDKFKTVMKPLTKQMTRGMRLNRSDSPGGRSLLERQKRVAISAEPAVAELSLRRVPKSTA